MGRGGPLPAYHAQVGDEMPGATDLNDEDDPALTTHPVRASCQDSHCSDLGGDGTSDKPGTGDVDDVSDDTPVKLHHATSEVTNANNSASSKGKEAFHKPLSVFATSGRTKTLNEYNDENYYHETERVEGSNCVELTLSSVSSSWSSISVVVHGVGGRSESSSDVTSYGSDDVRRWDPPVYGLGGGDGAVGGGAHAALDFHNEPPGQIQVAGANRQTSSYKEESHVHRHNQPGQDHTDTDTEYDSLPFDGGGSEDESPLEGMETGDSVPSDARLAPDAHNGGQKSSRVKEVGNVHNHPLHSSVDLLDVTAGTLAGVDSIPSDASDICSDRLKPESRVSSLHDDGQPVSPKHVTVPRFQTSAVIRDSVPRIPRCVQIPRVNCVVSSTSDVITREVINVSVSAPSAMMVSRSNQVTSNLLSVSRLPTFSSDHRLISSMSDTRIHVAKCGTSTKTVQDNAKSKPFMREIKATFEDSFDDDQINSCDNSDDGNSRDNSDDCNSQQNLTVKDDLKITNRNEGTDYKYDDRVSTMQDNKDHGINTPHQPRTMKAHQARSKQINGQQTDTAKVQSKSTGESQSQASQKNIMVSLSNLQVVFQHRSVETDSYKPNKLYCKPSKETRNRIPSPKKTTASFITVQSQSMQVFNNDQSRSNIQTNTPKRQTEDFGARETSRTQPECLSKTGNKVVALSKNRRCCSTNISDTFDCATKGRQGCISRSRTRDGFQQRAREVSPVRERRGDARGVPVPGLFNKYYRRYETILARSINLPLRQYMENMGNSSLKLYLGHLENSSRFAGSGLGETDDRKLCIGYLDNSTNSPDTSKTKNQVSQECPSQEQCKTKNQVSQEYPNHGQCKTKNQVSQEYPSQEQCKTKNQVSQEYPSQELCKKEAEKDDKKSCNWSVENVIDISEGGITNQNIERASLKTADCFLKIKENKTIENCEKASGFEASTTNYVSIEINNKVEEGPFLTASESTAKIQIKENGLCAKQLSTAEIIKGYSSESKHILQQSETTSTCNNEIFVGNLSAQSVEANKKFSNNEKLDHTLSVKSQANLGKDAKYRVLDKNLYSKRLDHLKPNHNVLNTTRVGYKSSSENFEMNTVDTNHASSKSACVENTDQIFYSVKNINLKVNTCTEDLEKINTHSKHTLLQNCLCTEAVEQTDQYTKDGNSVCAQDMNRAHQIMKNTQTISSVISCGENQNTPQTNAKGEHSKTQLSAPHKDTAVINIQTKHTNTVHCETKKSYKNKQLDTSKHLEDTDDYAMKNEQTDSKTGAEDLEPNNEIVKNNNLDSAQIGRDCETGEKEATKSLVEISGCLKVNGQPNNGSSGINLEGHGGNSEKVICTKEIAPSHLQDSSVCPASCNVMCQDCYEPCLVSLETCSDQVPYNSLACASDRKGGVSCGLGGNTLVKCKEHEDNLIANTGLCHPDGEGAPNNETLKMQLQQPLNIPFELRIGLHNEEDDHLGEDVPDRPLNKTILSDAAVVTGKVQRPRESFMNTNKQENILLERATANEYKISTKKFKAKASDKCLPMTKDKAGKTKYEQGETISGKHLQSGHKRPPSRTSFSTTKAVGSKTKVVVKPKPKSLRSSPVVNRKISKSSDQDKYSTIKGNKDIASKYLVNKSFENNTTFTIANQPKRKDIQSLNRPDTTGQADRVTHLPPIGKKDDGLKKTQRALSQGSMGQNRMANTLPALLGCRSCPSRLKKREGSAGSLKRSTSRLASWNGTSSKQNDVTKISTKPAEDLPTSRSPVRSPVRGTYVNTQWISQHPRLKPRTKAPSPSANGQKDDNWKTAGPQGKQSAKRARRDTSATCCAGSSRSAKRKVDGLTLFPPRILADGHYYPSKNVVCITVKPINCCISRQDLELQVRVLCQDSQREEEDSKVPTELPQVSTAKTNHKLIFKGSERKSSVQVDRGTHEGELEQQTFEMDVDMENSSSTKEDQSIL